MRVKAASRAFCNFSTTVKVSSLHQTSQSDKGWGVRVRVGGLGLHRLRARLRLRLRLRDLVRVRGKAEGWLGLTVKGNGPDHKARVLGDTELSLLELATPTLRDILLNLTTIPMKELT